VRASVIIPARDVEATLSATLVALAQQVGAPAFEVIVVDDRSRDATAQIAESAAVGVRVIRGAGEGPAAARNRGAAVATGDVLAFTDADCEPAPGWLAAGLAAFADADLVQGRVQPPPGVTVGPYDRHITVLAEYGLYETASLFVRRELFERLGGFESILTPRDGKELGEDVWLGWRARRAGARTTFCADALVHHVVFPRGPVGYAAERARLRFFPELARRIPELRDALFYRRVFLNARSARFDLALAGVGAAVLSRRLAPLALAAPYARSVASATRGPSRARRVAAELAADGVGAAALALGSLRSRSLLL
jgi:glycosyltransferase involved in cell wall biosynthesis